MQKRDKCISPLYLLPGISELVLPSVELAERLLGPVLRVLREVQDLHLHLGPLASASTWKPQGSYDQFKFRHLWKELEHRGFLR